MILGNITLSFDVSECQRVEFSDPERVELRHQFGQETLWIATFTANCYTVAMLGPPRTFWEQSAAHAVSHAVWVRTLPGPFDGAIDHDWLALALEANFQEADDVLAIAMQYLKGAPALFDGRMKIAGEAGYGPLTSSGKREEGSDFNDYLGIPWLYPGESPASDRPEPRQKGCLDCSGYMRMVWGFRLHLPSAAFRSGIPLCREERDASAMPRRAVDICAHAPGLQVIPDAGVRVAATELSRMQVADLVFFNADPGDGTDIDHVGMYMGRDDGGKPRFISSRKTANAPTLGDSGGKSILSGNGLYAKAFRAVRRL